MQRALIIPAAGLGSRLRSDSPKALVPVNGRPMLDHVIERFSPFVTSVIVVAAPSLVERLRTHLASTTSLTVAIAEQERPTGVLDAVLAATPFVEDTDARRVWIAWCDQVCVLPETLQALAAAEEATPLVFPTARRTAPATHFSRGSDGRIEGVVQKRELDPMPAEGETDLGVFSLDRSVLLEQLPLFAATVRIGAGTRERNFLPFIPWLAGRGRVRTIPATDAQEAVGINTPEELVAAEDWLRNRR